MKLYKNTYGIFGMVEQSTLIPAGNSRMRIDFTGGSVTVRGIEPATFTTDNLAVQKAIESSPLFHSGRIQLVKQYCIGETEAPADSRRREQTADEAVPEAGSILCVNYPDVRNVQQAREVLMAEPYGLTLGQLGNKEQIKAEAEKLNITFPNWK